MKTTDDKTAKKRILKAAAQEFAEKGFDGARVDTIAKNAMVNKALIYYYYKNKEELLELLFNELIETALSMFAALKNTDPQVFLELNAIRSMMYSFLDMLEARQNVVRVLIMEMTKRTPVNAKIFELINQYLETVMSLASDFDMETPENIPQAKVTEFFTGLMPMLDYVAYHEIWMERFNIDETTLREQFVESLIGTHFAYTLPHFPTK